MTSRDITDRIRGFWDADAAGYDKISGHYPQSPAEWAAWRGALEPLLPRRPPGSLTWAQERASSPLPSPGWGTR